MQKQKIPHSSEQGSAVRPQKIPQAHKEEAQY